MNKKEITVAIEKSPGKRKSNVSGNMVNKNSPQLKEFEKFMRKGKAKIAKFAAKRGSSNFELIKESEPYMDSHIDIRSGLSDFPELF